MNHMELWKLIWWIHSSLFSMPSKFSFNNFYRLQILDAAEWEECNFAFTPAHGLVYMLPTLMALSHYINSNHVSVTHSEIYTITTCSEHIQTSKWAPSSWWYLCYSCSKHSKLVEEYLICIPGHIDIGRNLRVDNGIK